MNGDLYYKHSGKYSLGGVVVGLIAGGVVAFPLAFAYAYLIQYNPFIYFNILASIAFGGLVGGLTSAALKRGKVRNARVTAVVAVIVGLVAFYVSWAAWVYALVQRVGQQISLVGLLRPAVLFALIRKVNEIGAWSLRDLTPKGAELWVIWSLEAAVIFGSAIFFALRVQDKPFCEMCERWCKDTEDVARVGAADPAQLKQRMEAKDFGFLEKLGSIDPDASVWFRLDLHSCPTCTTTNTLTVKSITTRVDKKGKRSERTRVEVDKLIIAPQEADTVRRLGGKTPEEISSSAG